MCAASGGYTSIVEALLTRRDILVNLVDEVK
jgi:hypothetical protein